MQTMTELQDAVYTTTKDLRALGFLVTITTNNTTVCGKVTTVDSPYDPLASINAISGEHPERVAVFVEQMKEIIQQNNQE